MCVCVCVKKIYLGSIFLFKQGWSNKAESLLFWSIFLFLSRVLYIFFFDVTILEFDVGWFVGFYGISTFVGYLTPNPFLCK